MVKENETNKKDVFDFDEDSYHITFVFNGNNHKNYQLTIHENYQLEDYVQLDEITKELKNNKVVRKFTHDDEAFELIEDELRPILTEICKFTQTFMKYE